MSLKSTYEWTNLGRGAARRLARLALLAAPGVCLLTEGQSERRHVALT